MQSLSEWLSHRPNGFSEKLFYELGKSSLESNGLIQIQSVPHIHKICSNIVNFPLCFLAADFIIVVELTFEITFRRFKKHTEKCFIPSELCHCSPSFFHSTLFTWMKNCPLFISTTFSDLGSADAFCQAFLLSVRNQGISLPSSMPRDNTIQGYHSKGQRGQGEKAAAKLGRNLVAGELEWGCAWMGRLNVRHSLLGLEDHLKERGCSENVRATTPGKARPKKKMHRFGLILKCLPTETDYTSCFKQMLFICLNVWISWRKRQIRPAARMNKTSHHINETGCREGSYLTTTALGKMRF